jgi:hypothetical protein
VAHGRQRELQLGPTAGACRSGPAPARPRGDPRPPARATTTDAGSVGLDVAPGEPSREDSTSHQLSQRYPFDPQRLARGRTEFPRVR